MKRRVRAVMVKTPLVSLLIAGALSGAGLLSGCSQREEMLPPSKAMLGPDDAQTVVMMTHDPDKLMGQWVSGPYTLTPVEGFALGGDPLPVGTKVYKAISPSLIQDVYVCHLPEGTSYGDDEEVAE